MGERDVVWEYGENLFPGFKCKYCVKEFHGCGAIRLKEHLAGGNENVARSLNVHRTYGTTFYVSCKGSESEKRPYGTSSSNPRYYAHVDGRVLCNVACATYVVVYLHVS
jgi:hypothetical protein